MADLTRVGQNNYKRQTCYAVSDASDTGDNTLFVLPKNILVLGVTAVVLTADGTGSSTLDIKVGSTVIANEVGVASTGVDSGTVVPGYFADGGTVTAVAGSTAPAGDGSVRIAVEYLELDTVTGDLTNY